MKILHITQASGGVETYLIQLIKELDATKYELFFLLSDPSKNFMKFCEGLNIKYYAIKMSRGINPYIDIKNMFQYKAVLKQVKPDIVHLHSAKAGFLGRIVAKKYNVISIFTPHGVSYLSFTGKRRLVFQFLEVLAKKYTQNVLACSHSEASRVINEIGIAENKVTVLPNAIDLSNSVCKINYRTNKIKIGIIARLTRQKNPLLFVEIASAILKKYDNVEFSMLGIRNEDELVQMVIDSVEEKNIQDRINILKWGDHSYAQKYLKEIDIFVLTSIFEGLPLSLLEAMSNGIPCVVSKCDGCNDVINNGENGFSCTDISDFVEKISFLIENSEIAYDLGRNGFEYVHRHHNNKDYFIKLNNYYSQLLHG